MTQIFLKVSNHPIAVLGLHAIKEKPVAIDGRIEIRPVIAFQFIRVSDLLTFNR